MSGSGLEARKLTVRFGGVTALDGVSFTLAPGEVHGIVGPNGSGKTTLFNAVSGFVRASEGTVVVDGHDSSNEPAERRIRRGIVRTFQTPRFDQDLSVEETVKAGQRYAVRGGLLSSMMPTPRVAREERIVRTNTDEVLQRFRLDHVRKVRLGELPMGLVRLTEVARAVAMRPRYLLLDEPAAGLSSAEQGTLVRQLRELASEDELGVLIVEHNFGLLRGLVSELTVLQTGRAIARGTPDQVAADPAVQAAYLGVPDNDDSEGVSEGAVQDEVALALDQVQVSYGRIRVCDNVSLVVKRGEFVALMGANGAGKSSLLDAVAGLGDSGRRCVGALSLSGQQMEELDPALRARAGLAHVPEGRGNIFPGLTTQENLVLANRVAAPLHRADALARAIAVFPALESLLSRVAGSMSGGEQQMLAIAVALAQAPTVVLLDEPTQGLAPAVRLGIADAFKRLRYSGGPSVLLAEQNFAFARRVADRVVVMRAGRLVESDGTEQLDSQVVAHAYLGGDDRAPDHDDSW